MNIHQRWRTVLLIRGLCGVAWWTLVFTLALLLAAPPYRFSAYEIAWIVTGFAISDQGTAILWSPLTRRLPERLLFGLGAALAAAGLLGLASTTVFGICAISVIVVGCGSSLTSLAPRLWIIAHYPEHGPRLHAFGTLYRTVNLAAAGVPPLVFALPFQQHSRTTILTIAAGYAIAALGAWRTLPTTPLPLTPPTLRHEPSSTRLPWGPLAAITIAFALSLAFLFQTNLIPYYYAHYRTQPSHLGWILALPPLLVVLVQGRMTALVARWNRRGLTWKYLVGFALYTAAFALFSQADTGASLVLFILGLTLGEMCICPFIDHDAGAILPPTKVAAYLALNGVWFAIARAAAEGGGLAALQWLTAHGLAVHWWWGTNALLGLTATATAGLLAVRASVSRRNPKPSVCAADTTTTEAPAYYEA